MPVMQRWVVLVLVALASSRAAVVTADALPHASLIGDTPSDGFTAAALANDTLPRVLDHSGDDANAIQAKTAALDTIDASAAFAANATTESPASGAIHEQQQKQEEHIQADATLRAPAQPSASGSTYAGVESAVILVSGCTAIVLVALIFKKQQAVQHRNERALRCIITTTFLVVSTLDSASATGLRTTDNNEPSLLLLNQQRRDLAGADATTESPMCHAKGSFLGVGNTGCLHENLGTAVFLLGVIIVISICFDKFIHCVRRAIACPQLARIVNRIFQEVMIMGFISMVIFTLNTSGALTSMHLPVDTLTASEQLHFYEFFHYIVFLTMIYFILIVLLLLFIGTVVPKLIWSMQTSGRDNSDDSDDGASDDDNHNGGPYSDDGDDANGDTTAYDSGELYANDRISLSPRGFAHRHSTLRRAKSGMDMVQGSRAYNLLLERYNHEGWCFRFNVVKQWHLWKSFEILAYNICQHRSGYIYKNPDAMERLFGVTPPRSQRTNLLRLDPADSTATSTQAPMTYATYHALCMRNLLFHISDLHVSALVILVVISVLPSLYPEYDHWIFIGVGGVLLVANVVIFFKVLYILRGIVDDRLRVITMRDIHLRLRALMHEDRSNGNGGRYNRPGARAIPTDQSIAVVGTGPIKPCDMPTTQRRPPLRLKTVALSVRAVIRMQMSALCHRQLHYHDDRFWFHSPTFLLRVFQFATISQAFYLVWLSLVAAPTVWHSDNAAYLLPIMVLLPFVALCIITPMTMPSFVLVMSLTGIFVDLNTERSAAGSRTTYEVTKTNVRLMRRSFLKSRYSDVGGGGNGSGGDNGSTVPPQSPALETPSGGVTSPTSVFLRIYDSPTAAAAAAHERLGSEFASPSNAATLRSWSGDRDDLQLLAKARRSVNGGSSGGSLGRSGNSSRTNSLGRRSRDDSGYSGPRRAFNLAAFQASMTPSVLGTVYNSPRTYVDGAGSNRSAPSSNNGNAAGKSWSQAQVAPATKRTIASAAATSSSNDDALVAADPTPSPAAESFKRYCSKYGGYPDV